MAISSVTLEPVILNWKSDGTTFYRIRVTLRREKRYIKSNVLVRKDQFTKGGKLKDPGVRDALDKFMLKVRESINSIDSLALSGMSAAEVVRHIERAHGGGFKLDFFSFAEETIAKKRSKSTRDGYTCAVNSYKEFVHRDIDISEITSSELHRWEEWLMDKHGKGARAVSSYTAALRHIHAQARAQYNNEETGYVPIRNPFQFYKPPQQKPAVHRAIDRKVISKMLQLRKSLEGRERIGVDVFLLSFTLMGMNSPDMYTCAPPKKGIITYNRTKTRDRRSDRALMKVRLDERILPLVAEYTANRIDRAFIFSELYTSYQILGENVNEGLKTFCERIKYDGKITLYSARHSWASLAYKAGVNKSVINDCLCHVDKDMKVTDIYIDKDWSVMWKANKKVLSLFDWASAF